MKERIPPFYNSAALQLARGGQWLTLRKEGAFLLPGAVIVVLLLMFSGVTAAVAAVAAWIALLRHFAATDADRQRRITESHGKAIEQLGSDKIEIRLGGIYTLERISNESFYDYWTVMETLCAFICEKGPWPVPKVSSSEAQAEPLVKAGQTDIRAALTAICRRDPKHQQREGEYGFQLDFRQTDLQHAFLYEANLHGANFFGANLSEATLMSADLGEAYPSAGRPKRRRASPGPTSARHPR